MATDGPDPTPCDPKLCRHGETVAVSETYGANHFECLIELVRQDTGRQVDWHYAGGYAVVLAYAKDAATVRESFERIVRPIIQSKREEAIEAIRTGQR